MEADEAGDEDGVVELDCAAEAGGGVDPGGFRLGRLWFGVGWLVSLHSGSMV
jgi:hypothetical protein